MFQRPSTESFSKTQQLSIPQPSYQKITITQLRKITPDDTFPCFSCFDDPTLRSTCQACNKLGYVKGDHPMVRFVDDFLGKNLLAHMQEVADNGGQLPVAGQQSENSQQAQNRAPKQPYSNSVLTRKQCRSALQSYTSKQPHPELPTKLLKSSNPVPCSPPEQIHHNFACNYCQALPIKGTRYHCQECEDFDLCETCYMTIKNNRLEFGEHRAGHRVGQVAKKLRPEDMVEKLVRVQGVGKGSISGKSSISKR